MSFESSFLEFIKLLNLLIGGMAVNIYGYNRSTGDMDIWMKPDNENGKRIIKAIDDFGFDASTLGSKNFEVADVFFLGEPPHRIDVLTKVRGVKFDEAYKNKKIIEIEGIAIDVVGLDDLKAIKFLSGRHKDLDDLQNLNKEV